MVLITSTGFTNPEVYKFVEDHSEINIRKACIIPTATLPDKAEHPIAQRVHSFLKEKGVMIVDFFDIEYEDPFLLQAYDLIFILGGNSSHLHFHAYKSGFMPMLKKLIMDKKIVIGASAGALLLTTGNHYTKYFNKILRIDEGGYYADGLGITNDILFPHYDMMCERFIGLEDKLKTIEDKCNIKLKRLKNMDFIAIDDDGVVSEFIN